MTNGVFAAFSGDRRVQVDLGSVRFLVLDKMIQVAEHLYAEAKASREARGSGPQAALRPVRPQDKLRARDPW